MAARDADEIPRLVKLPKLVESKRRDATIMKGKNVGNVFGVSRLRCHKNRAAYKMFVQILISWRHV